VIAAGSQAHAAADALTIGVQLPLTGERAQVGRMIKNGIEMALEEVNRSADAGGASIAAVFEDSRSSEEGAIAAARTLTADPRVVAVVGELFSPFAMASRETIEQAGMPYLIGGTSPRTTEGARWIFRVGPSDRLLAELVARYVVETLKLKHLAVLSSAIGVHNARADLVVDLLRERYGVSPPVRERWKPEDRDFTAQLDRVHSAAVQGIVAFGESAEGAPFLRQLRARGIDLPVIAHRDFAVSQVLKDAGAAAEGLRVVTEYLPALLDADRRAWADAYEKRFGTEANVIAAQYHDAVLLIVRAARHAGASRAGIKTGLERLTDFRGKMADYTFDAGHNGVHRLYVARISGGHPVLEAVLQETH
jgi:branched-chain amino acid transport system substrate-binding protein